MSATMQDRGVSSDLEESALLQLLRYASQRITPTDSLPRLKAALASLSALESNPETKAEIDRIIGLVDERILEQKVARRVRKRVASAIARSMS